MADSIALVLDIARLSSGSASSSLLTEDYLSSEGSFEPFAIISWVTSVAIICAGPIFLPRVILLP